MRIETIAGITSFLAAAYLLVVIPSLLAAGGMDRITYEYLADAAAHQVRHSEFFWNPTGMVRVSKFPYADAQAAIVAAIRDAARAVDHRVRCIGGGLPA